MDQDIINALIGGGLIGTSASLMLRLNGKVTGISGIVESSLFGLFKHENLWKVIFLAGLLFGGLALSLLYPELLKNEFNQNIWLTSLGGILVGFGTRLGSGCTSGHGVCGVSRLSKRSIIATLCFMFSGFLTVLLGSHFLQSGGL